MAQVAWVTGAGRGIGAVLARALAAQGLAVAVSARTQTELERVAADIRGHGGLAQAVPCDATDPASVAKAAAAIRAVLGPVAILVNNAGAAESHKFIGHDDALWHRMIRANLDATYFVTKAAVPMMVEAQWGRIVNIASIAAKVGARYVAAYTAAKHGVLGLTRALAVELLPHHITVNAVCPGYVDTPLTERSIANIAARAGLSEAEARAVLEKASPQNRLMQPDEVAHVLLMLVAEQAHGITGQAINVDGGTVMF